jgi:hypothetical protein
MVTTANGLFSTKVKLNLAPGLGPFKVEIYSSSPYISVFHDILTEDEMTWCQSYKTCLVRNSLIFVLSYSVCPWHAFPA